jgi:hypothetical protein
MVRNKRNLASEAAVRLVRFPLRFMFRALSRTSSTLPELYDPGMPTVLSALVILETRSLLHLLHMAMICSPVPTFMFPH